MEKEYIKISGKAFRVVVNWNAISDYCEQKGIKDLSELDKLSQFTPADLLPMAHACIKEGERMDGRTLNMTSKELGTAMSVPGMGEFAKIYARQTIMSVQKDSPASKKKWWGMAKDHMSQ